MKNYIISLVALLSIYSCTNDSYTSPISDNNNTSVNQCDGEEFSEQKIKQVFSEVFYLIGQNGFNKTDIPAIYRNICPSITTKAEEVTADPILLTNEVAEQNKDFIMKMEVAIVMKKEDKSTLEIGALFADENEKEAAFLLLDFIEQNKELLHTIAIEANNEITQTRAELTICDVAASVSSLIIADLATMTGVGAAVAGPLGIGVAAGSALVGAVGGLAYTALFC